MSSYHWACCCASGCFIPIEPCPICPQPPWYSAATGYYIACNHPTLSLCDILPEASTSGVFTDTSGYCWFVDINITATGVPPNSGFLFDDYVTETCYAGCTPCCVSTCTHCSTIHRAICNSGLCGESFTAIIGARISQDCDEAQADSELLFASTAVINEYWQNCFQVNCVNDSPSGVICSSCDTDVYYIPPPNTMVLNPLTRTTNCTWVGNGTLAGASGCEHDWDVTLSCIPAGWQVSLSIVTRNYVGPPISDCSECTTMSATWRVNYDPNDPCGCPPAGGWDYVTGGGGLGAIMEPTLILTS